MEKRRNCSLGAISPLFHNILLPVIRFSCLGRDHIFTSRYAVIQDKRVRDSESQLYFYKFFFAVYLYNHRYPLVLIAESQRPDQNARIYVDLGLRCAHFSIAQFTELSFYVVSFCMRTISGSNSSATSAVQNERKL